MHETSFVDSAPLEFMEGDSTSPTRLLDEYHNMRMIAMNGRFPDEETERLSKVHKSTSKWIEATLVDSIIDYGAYDREIVHKKMMALIDYLRQNHPEDVTEEEITATELFIDSTFALYDSVMGGDSRKNGLGLSFAFLVPGRASRNNEDYGSESELIIPILRYVPNKYRSLFIHGVPPFILDFYEADDEGKKGAVICALVSPEDMFPNPDNYMSKEEYNQAFMVAGLQAINGVNNATEFARRLGAEVAGLGAVLPRIVDYGNRIDSKGIYTTTGHAGTIVLIFQAIEAAVQSGLVDESMKKLIAVVGLGKIGASIAHLSAEYYPDSTITIYDQREAQTARIAEKLKGATTNVVVAESITEVLSRNGIVISAITTPLTPEELQACREGMLIIDDSQPACVDPMIAKQFGAVVQWVVGKQQDGVFLRRQWGYGTFADNQGDLFGCEIETTILYALRRDLAKEGYPQDEIDAITNQFALTGPVTPDKVKLWFSLFERYGIEPAAPQSFGQYVI